MNIYPTKLLWCLGFLALLGSCNKEERGFKRYYEKAVLPQAKFVITQIENCQPPYRVHFENQSYDTLGNETFKWEYGNGDTSHSSAAAVASYGAAGEYLIKLIAINAVGRDTFDTLIVLPESQEISADFTFESAYGADFWEPCPVQFTNLSNHAKTYTWEFGDGDKSFLENPEHIFTEKGTYTVTLFSECGGQEKTHFESLTVSGPPRSFTIEELHLLFLPEKYMNDLDTADGTRGIDLFFEAFIDGQNVLSGSVIQGVQGPREFPIIWKSDKKIPIDNYNTPLLIRYFDDDFNGNPQFIATMTIDLSELQNNFYPSSFSKFDEDDLETKLIMKWKNQ